jgi:putative flippase GtrA
VTVRNASGGLPGLVGTLVRRREFAFLVVGGINTAVGLGAFLLLYDVWGGRLHYMGALVLAYAVGIAVAFVLHRRFVFKVEGNVLLDLVRFTGVQCVSLGLNAVLLPLLVEGLAMPVPPAQVLALAVVVVGSYFGHLLISFRR